jgi:hypothetical protein
VQFIQVLQIIPPSLLLTLLPLLHVADAAAALLALL